MLTKEEKTLILAALFHDIGKFRQRGIEEQKRLKHQEYSSGFVNEIFKDEVLATFVANHHREDLDKSGLKGNNRILAEILCEADNLASGERKPDPLVKKQQPLESIFSKVYNVNGIKLNPKLYFQEISELDYKNYKFPISNQENLNLEQQYSDWWKKFEEEIKKADPDELETLFYVMKKYLWCIPSSSYKTRSDVSLFEHSKITAAIAISLFRYLLEKHNNEIKDIKDIENRDEARYLLILADITGIQSYIYNIGHKGAAKALKGRSFLLQQTLDNVAYYVLDKKLKLPITNLIYSSDGKFYIFAPNTKSVNETLDEVKKELEKRFLDEYNGALGLVIASLELTGRDLEYVETGKKHPISEKWDELNSLVEREKKRKLSLNWDYSLFEPAGIDGEIEKCAFTGKPLIKKELIENKKTNPQVVKLHPDSEIKFIKHSYGGNVFYQIPDSSDFISEEQFISQKIGSELKSGFDFMVFEDQLVSYSILKLNSFSFKKGYEYENIFNSSNPRMFLINSLDINKLKGKANKGFKFLGGDWRFGDTYEELTQKGEGIERLGVLRLDVDNLGKIFKDGFEANATFGRIVQLSSMLDFFFSHYINKLKEFSWDPKSGLSDNYKKFKFKIRDLIEIVYSGGDDVFIVGHWSVLPDIALWINDEFRKFTAFNENFTISAGITLFDDKYPIYKAAMEAGEFESKTKSRKRENRDQSKTNKNGICFLDENTPVSWNDFKRLRSFVGDFYEWVSIGLGNEHKKLSKGFIHRLYFIYYEYKQGKFNNWSKWRWRASYSLTRLAKQYDTFSSKILDFASELFTSDKTEQELVRLLYILANWTDLLTRKKNQQ
jgi:CRISPR-associated protein Csm1